jgi:hypothetical protein
VIISIGFDGVLVEDRPLDDFVSPMTLKPWAREALDSLKRADHALVLASSRANLALRENWRLNPLWLYGKVPLNVEAWERNRPMHQQRWFQMLHFIEDNLKDVFDAVDDGRQGKFPSDLIIDHRSVGSGEIDWYAIARQYGEPIEVS